MSLIAGVLVLVLVMLVAVGVTALIVREDRQRCEDLGHVSDRTLRRYEREADDA